MWLFTTFGFFSVVIEDHPNDPKDKGALLKIRARVRKDLERFKETYLPNASDIVDTTGTDYPYRMWVWRSDLSHAMAKIVTDITYKNFKSEVAAKQSWDVEKLYAQVWSVMYGAERKIADNARASKSWSDDWKKGSSSSSRQGSFSSFDSWRDHKSSKVSVSGKGTHVSSSGKSYVTGPSGTLEPFSWREPGSDDGEGVEIPSYPTHGGPIGMDDAPEADLDADFRRKLEADDSFPPEIEEITEPQHQRTEGRADWVLCPWCNTKSDVTQHFGDGMPTEGAEFECAECGGTNEIRRVLTSRKGRVVVVLAPVEDEDDDESEMAAAPGA